MDKSNRLEILFFLTDVTINLTQMKISRNENVFASIPKNHENSYLCFQLVLLQSVFYFFLHQSPSSSLSTVFGAISSNIEKVLSVRPIVCLCTIGEF